MRKQCGKVTDRFSVQVTVKAPHKYFKALVKNYLPEPNLISIIYM